jgi:cobalt-precorrin 5A hydrolase / cobalt-factor III methyltransferase / precorrin-3B C17-methyltransferase
MAALGPPAIVVLGPSGLEIARKAAGVIEGAEIHAAFESPRAAFQFDQLKPHLQELYMSGRPVVGVCAAGILIRLLAPVLEDKHAEPPVLALAENGSAVVPLLGGHHGANDLARRLADAFGCGPAITTAGDLRFGVALDAPPAGWRLANPSDYKDFAAALLAAAAVRLDGAAPWLAESALPFAEDAALTIRVSDDCDPGDADRLVYNPQHLAVGIGCERNAEPEEVVALVVDALTEAGLAQGSVAGVFSIDLKMDEPAVHAAAAALGVPVRFFDAARLEAETPRLANPSEAVFREVGCHGVAEGAALVAAGPEGVLVVPKQKSRRATCAVARALAPLDMASIGKPRGHLTIVGIGPGDARFRTPDAEAAIRSASDIVGYRLYLDLLGPLTEGKMCHGYELGKEEARVRAALDLAADGRSVALVSSGDAGIYAMGALVFELLDRSERADWRRVAVTCAPGISALQAAAARIGAPLGHDFCAISLSDLMTPWEVIERRVRAAAEGDFVIAFYNPVSRRRTTQVGAAREILLSHRPAETPVVLARNLGRPGESVEVLALKDLAAERVDMLTLVLVGSSETRRIHKGDGGVWVYTPRGYGAREPVAQK